MTAFLSSGQPAWMRTRLDTVTLSHTDVPALTVDSGLSQEGDGLNNLVFVYGSSGGDWTLNVCARGEADTDAAATGYMKTVSFSRKGSLVTLGGPVRNGNFGPWATLDVEAPPGAPIDINDSFGAVRVEGVTGPVWVSSPVGRTTILNTTGSVDATAFIVDFAGSCGPVVLHSGTINLKLTETVFRGALHAAAEGPVKVLLPRKFQTPFQAMVKRKRDFVCRADLCSAVRQQETNGWYTFSYRGGGRQSTGPVTLRSDRATVVIDNW